MSKYWAKVNNNLVEKVIVANEEFFDTFVDETHVQRTFVSFFLF